MRFSNRSVSRTVMTHLLQRPQGKVLIRVNGIDPCKAIIKELIQKRIYRKNEILQLYSTSEIKGSTDYMNLAHNSKFLDRYKIVFTTSLIDEGLSIDQAGFTDVIFIETDYNPRPEPIKQFFARFRNEDANRKNYLYLRKKKCQIPTCFRPQELFENGVEALQNNTNDESMDVLTTYDNLFSNNNYYYNNENINPYYLAFASTELLFQKMNIEQFLAYLKLNYNLGFTRNDSYEVRKLETNENGFKKELNKQIAMY